MLLRAVGRHIGAAVNLQKQAARSIALSRAVFGGHGHHHEPTPVYIPKPGSLDWSLCGKRGAHSEAKHQFAPYEPEIGSFIGAVAFIGLTVAAVLLKTETFKKDDGHHDKHHEKKHHDEHHEKKHQEKKAEPEHHEEKVEKVKAEEKKPEEEEANEKEAPIVHEEEKEKKEEVKKEQKEEPKSAEPAAEQKNETEETSAPSTSSDKKPAADEEKPTTSGESKEEKLHCEYVIIGSGTAAYYASLAIRAKHAEAKVLMIGSETELPYNRPPLSKELFWYGDETSVERLDYTSLSGKKRDIYYEVDGFFVSPEDLPKATHGGVSLLKGRTATKICADDKRVILDDGQSVGYEKVLIATGVRPKREKVFEEASEEARQRITYYHYPSDFRRVEGGLSDKSVKKLTIVGNGLLASELAYSIKRKYPDVEINQVFEEKYAAEDVLPAHLAEKSTNAMKSQGIVIKSERKVGGVRKCCKNVVLELVGGEEVRSDLIVVATGEEPNSEIIEASGLSLDKKRGGVRADKFLKVADNVWAAGAIVSFEDAVLGKRRISSWEHAQVSGRLAGENMATAGSSEKAFWYQPSFFTKFAPHMHINAIGRCDSNLETVSIYAEPEKEKEHEMEKAVVFYKSNEDGSIVGVLLLNVFGPSLDVARRIIDDKKKVDDFKEIVKLFPLYEMPKNEEEEKEKSA